MKQPAIYVVDDDRIVLMLLDHLLKKHHSTAPPVLREDSKTALTDLKSLPPEKNVLLFLDLNMPEVSGRDILDYIQNHSLSHRVTVVIVSSSVDKRDKELVEEYDCVVGYFEKPVRDQELEKIKHEKQVKYFFEH